VSSPAIDPAGGKPPSPTRSTGAFMRALGILFFIGNVTVLWPVFFVIGVVVDVWRIRGRLFPVGFRARRGHFWNVILIYLCLGGLVIIFIYAVAGEGGIISKTTANVLAGVLGGAMMVSFLAVSVSRLHDRDQSGWWIFLYFGIPAAAIVRLSLVRPADWEFTVLVGAIMGFVPWAIFALGFMPGTVGPNRFGEESPWFRDTRRKRKHTAPPPVPHPLPAAQPAAGVPSAAVTQAPAPANPDPVPEIHAPVAATQAPAIAAQASVAQALVAQALATDPAGGKPASPAHSKIGLGELARRLRFLLIFGPLFPVILIVVFGVMRGRGLLFPVGFRVRRKHFWIVTLIFLCLGGVVIASIYAAANDGDISRTSANVLAAVLGGAMMASVLAISVSRLHDRDLSGWWVFVYYGFPAAAIVRLSLGNAADWEIGSLVIVISVFAVWAIFALGLKPGTIGPNRFGEESPRFRDIRQEPQHTAPPPVPPSPPAAQPAAGVPSAAAAQAPAPANSDSVPEIHAPAVVTQAPAIAPQALVAQTPAAAVVSPPAKAQFAPMSAPAAPTDVQVRIREIVGDLISVKGRLDSRSYWICSAIQCAYALLAWLAIHLVTSDRNISQRAYWISVGVIAFLPAALSMIASAIKRLHDRDLSAWWLPGSLIILAAGIEAFYLIFDQQFVAMDGPFIFAIWAVAIHQCGRTPGTAGPNRFGPDPLD
jgi:uncharacterized membrane protein YhaH (DUF805 family)